MKKETDDKDLTVDSYDYLGKSASATDYTGLIPSAPRNDYELESYEDIYPFRPGLRANTGRPPYPARQTRAAVRTKARLKRAAELSLRAGDPCFKQAAAPFPIRMCGSLFRQSYSSALSISPSDRIFVPPRYGLFS